MSQRTARYLYDPASGGMIDTTTGEVIRPGDPGWRPQWTATMAELRSIPAGMHAVFDAAGNMTFEPNEGPWYTNPAMLMTLGVGGAGAAFGAAGAAGGASAGADAAEMGSDLAGTGAGISTTAGSVAPAVVPASLPAAASTWIPGVSNGTVIGAGINLFGSLWGASKAAGANTDAANITANANEQIAKANADAQKYAADLQAKATADALAFSKSSAENAFQNNEVARQGNYDQYAAAQTRIGSVAKLLGFGDRVIPAYRPGVDPHYTGVAGSAGSGYANAFTPTSAGNPTDPAAIQAALAKFYASVGATPTGRGTGPTDSAYYGDQIAATGGLTPQNIAYWFGPTGRIASDLSGAGAVSAPTMTAKVPSVASMFTTVPTSGAPTVPITPALTMPNPYAIASYVS